MIEETRMNVFGNTGVDDNGKISKTARALYHCGHTL